jgi:hypothetical protein
MFVPSPGTQQIIQSSVTLFIPSVHDAVTRMSKGQPLVPALLLLLHTKPHNTSRGALLSCTADRRCLLQHMPPECLADETFDVSFKLHVPYALTKSEWSEGRN